MSALERIDPLLVPHDDAFGQAALGRGAAPPGGAARPGGLLGFYLRNPGVAWVRAALTLTRGFVNEYLLAAARRVDAA